MSEENNAGDGGQGDGVSDFKPITSQDALDKIIGDRVARERGKYADYDDLKAKASKFDEAENASKSEIQKEREAREAAEKERDSLRAEGLRAQVALAKGLTPTQAKRLVGSTKEELEADADELLSDLKPPSKKPDPKNLKSGSGSEDNAGMTGKDRAAAALRSLRN